MTDRGPPLQFIPANGTSFCLLSNEYDKNTYARCGYVGNRTLLRCNEVRRKEELAKRSGICEIHAELSNNIRKNYQLEKLHLANDCPPRNVKKEKFYRSFYTDELALDENPFFAPVDAWYPRTFPNSYETSVPEDILSSGYEGAFTEKELISMQIDIAKKEIQELEAYRERHRSTAANLAKKLNSEKSKKQTLTGIQAQHYTALLNYGKPSRDDKRVAFMALGPYPDLRKPCIFGMHDQEVITMTLCDIVGKVASDGQKNPVPPKCSGYAIPGTELCLQHIHTDSTRKFPFSTCDMCKNVVFFEGQNLCVVHQYTARGFMKSLKRKAADVNNIFINFEDVAEFEKQEELQAQKERELAAKKARRTVVAPRNISFTSVSPAQHTASSMASHILSMYKGDEIKEEPKKRTPVTSFTSGMESARCRPFNKDYFGKKEHPASSRTTLPFGTPPVLPASAVPTPLQRANTVHSTFPSTAGTSSMASSSVVNYSRPGIVQQTYQTTRPKAAMPRMSQMDRIRNRMQQEEDQKAAASILDDRPDSLSNSTSESGYRTAQYRVVTDSFNRQKAPPSRATIQPPRLLPPGPSGIQQTIDINNLPDEMKQQSLGTVLKTGMRTGVTITSRGNAGGVGSTAQPRMLQQAPVRRPTETMPTKANYVPVSQRHQIANVEVPKSSRHAPSRQTQSRAAPSRQPMVPPHRLHPQAHAPAAPPPAAAPPRPGQSAHPRVIPLEREGLSLDKKGVGGSGRNTPVTPLDELLAQGRKTPSMGGSRPATPDSTQDLARKRVKAQLPLPTVSGVTPRPRTTVPQPVPYPSNRNITTPRILQNHPPSYLQKAPSLMSRVPEQAWSTASRLPAPSLPSMITHPPRGPLSGPSLHRPQAQRAISSATSGTSASSSTRQPPSDPRGALKCPPLPPALPQPQKPGASVSTRIPAPSLPSRLPSSSVVRAPLKCPPVPPPLKPPTENSTTAAASSSKTPSATETSARAKMAASRQSPRKNSRPSTSENKDSTDPLSLLADVSAAVSQPAEDDDYEEEL